MAGMTNVGETGTGGDFKTIEKSLNELSKSLKETGKTIREDSRKRAEATLPRREHRDDTSIRDDIDKSIRFFSEKIDKLATTSEALANSIEEIERSKDLPTRLLANIKSGTPEYAPFKNREAELSKRIKDADRQLESLRRERVANEKFQEELTKLIELQQGQMEAPGGKTSNAMYNKFSALGETVPGNVKAQMFLQAKGLRAAMKDIGTPRDAISNQMKQIQDKIDRNMDLAFRGASTGKDEKGRFRRLTTLAMNDARQLLDLQKLKTKQDSDFKMLKDRVEKEKGQFANILDTLYGPAVNPKLRVREDLLKKLNENMEDLTDNIDDLKTNLKEAELSEKIAGLRRKTERSWVLNPAEMLSKTIGKYKDKAIAATLGGLGKVTGLSALTAKSQLITAEQEEEEFAESRQERQASKHIRSRKRELEREQSRMEATADELDETVTNIEEINDELREVKKHFEDVYSIAGIKKDLADILPEAATPVMTEKYRNKIKTFRGKINAAGTATSGISANDARTREEKADRVQEGIEDGINTLVDLAKKEHKTEKAKEKGETKASSGMGLTALALGLVQGVAGYEAAKVAKLWSFASKIPGMAKLAAPMKTMMSSKLAPIITGGREITAAAKTGLGGIAKLGGMGVKAALGAETGAKALGWGAKGLSMIKGAATSKISSVLGTAGKVAGGVAKVMPIIDVLGLAYGGYKGATMDDKSKQAEIERLRQANSTFSGGLWEATKTFFNPVQQGKNIALAAREGGGLVSDLYKNHMDGIAVMKKTTALKERQIKHLQDMGASDSDISALRGAALENDDLFQKKYREILMKNKDAEKETAKASAVPPASAAEALRKATDIDSKEVEKATDAVKTSPQAARDKAIADAMNRGFEMVADTIVKNKPVVTTIVPKGSPPRDSRYPVLSSALPSGAGN